MESPQGRIDSRDLNRRTIGRLKRHSRSGRTVSVLSTVHRKRAASSPTLTRFAEPCTRATVMLNPTKIALEKRQLYAIVEWSFYINLPLHNMRIKMKIKY